MRLACSQGELLCSSECRVIGVHTGGLLRDLDHRQANLLPDLNRTSSSYSPYAKLPTIAVRTSGLGQSAHWLKEADFDRSEVLAAPSARSARGHCPRMQTHGCRESAIVSAN